jgi:hypothetical protein
MKKMRGEEANKHEWKRDKGMGNEGRNGKWRIYSRSKDSSP